MNGSENPRNSTRAVNDTDFQVKLNKKMPANFKIRTSTYNILLCFITLCWKKVFANNSDNSIANLKSTIQVNQVEPTL